jgi:hypothetical protein
MEGSDSSKVTSCQILEVVDIEDELFDLAYRLSVIGPWADYVRSVIAQVAPEEDIMGDLYNNIPLGSDYAFQGTNFIITNALLLVTPPPFPLFPLPP